MIDITGTYVQRLAAQRLFAASAPLPLANFGSKEDPADLGRLVGATNIDVETYDHQIGYDLTTVRNFVNASVFDLPFDDDHFASGVLGDLLEHCYFEPAVKMFKELRRVIRPGGPLMLTFPLDPRPPEQQHADPKCLYELEEPGTFTYHVKVWDTFELNRLFNETGWDCTGSVELQYGNLCPGWAIYLRRPV